jgi:hypothetical protein
MGDKTVQRSSSVARRLGTVGLAAFVVGAVLLGTGIAASAQTKAAAAGPLKKKPTTTTSTTTTTTPPPTTTQPCNAQAGTGTAAAGKGQGTLVATPPGATGTPGTQATCVVNGTLLTLAATGLTPLGVNNNALGTFIECNDDPSQPTFSILGNAIPISCTGALKYVFTPNAAGTANMPDPNAQPAALPAFTVVGGTTGPPCVPTLCTGNDSAGNSPYTDAANYPCPPTAAQIAAGDTCVVAVGDTGGDQVTVPIEFNPNVPPPPATVGTAPPTSPGGATATTAPKAKTAATGSSSNALAFTGSGPGLWWLALVGLLLMVFGGLLLTVVDQPRRLVQVALRRTRRTHHDT